MSQHSFLFLHYYVLLKFLFYAMCFAFLWLSSLCLVVHFMFSLSIGCWGDEISSMSFEKSFVSSLRSMWIHVSKMSSYAVGHWVHFGSFLKISYDLSKPKLWPILTRYCVFTALKISKSLQPLIFRIKLTEDQVEFDASLVDFSPFTT